MCNSASFVCLFVVAGCNAIFGLHEVAPAHEQFDAPIDAQPACPPLGGLPHFSTLVKQAFFQNCTTYDVSSTGTAIGLCTFASGNGLGLGTRDQPMTLIQEIPDDLQNRIYDAHISPDGDHIVVHTAFSSAHVYQRAGSSWQLLADPPWGGVGAFQLTSSIAQGPNADIIFLRTTSGYQEWWYEAASWHEVPVTFDPGSTEVRELQLATDGLRAYVVGAANQLYFTDRPDLVTPFRPLVAVTDAPFFETVYVTDDCTRLYTAGLGSVAYVEAR